MGITRIVKMSFQQDYAEEFEIFFTKIQNQVASQPGCNGVKLLKQVGETGVFFTYSSWNSEADLNQYRQSEVFGMIWPKVKAWFVAKPEAWSVEEC